MARVALPLHIQDLSAFARSLGRALAERPAGRTGPPGHVELLNLIARAAGHRNLQALRAAAPPPADVAPPAGTPPAASAPPPLTELARKTLAQFDDQGRLVRWPVKYSVQRLAMWVLWTLFDAKRVYTESEVNAVLRQANDFGDHVTLRRELVNHKLLSRKSDCSEYRKLAARPDDETRALLAAWRAQVRGQRRPRGTPRSPALQRRPQALRAAPAP